jgi:poly(A) polymerase
MTAPESRAVLDALTAEGATVRFVGGSVRDALLGRAVTDIDLATPDRPERVMALLDRAEIRNIPTGIEHGTVTAVIGKIRFEVTTLRVDVRTDGRHAEVAFTDDWEADAARRDFTINAMSCASDGTLFDYFGGRADLKAGRVRFVGEPAKRIAEDYLRVLRFFRFEAWYGRGAPDEAALAACRAAAGKLASLSGERVRSEMFRLLEAADPAPALALMEAAGILAAVLPETGDRSRLTSLLSIDTEFGVDPLMRLGSLLSNAQDAADVGVRWRLSNEERSRLALLVAPPMTPAPDWDNRQQRKALYRLGRSMFCDLVLLAWAGHSDGTPFRPMLETAAAWTDPALPISGADALALGIEAGPAVGGLLSAAEQWWIEQDFAPTRDEMLEKLSALASAERNS